MTHKRPNSQPFNGSPWKKSKKNESFFLSSTPKHAATITKLFEERKRLPIFPAKSQFIKKITRVQSAIVIGETGSGKTTQIPQVHIQSICTISLGPLFCFSPPVSFGIWIAQGTHNCCYPGKTAPH
jgi:HrpA-like RNA helicase